MSKKYNLSEIVLTAVITAILTSVSSFILTRSQLSQEQVYWEQRLQKERLVEMLDRQIALYEEINTGILNTESLARELKIRGSEFNVNISMARLGKQDIKEINTAFQEKAMEYHKHIYNFSGKLQLIPLYFSNRVDSLINPLRIALENNGNHNLSIGDVVELDKIKEYLNKDYETIEELKDVRMKILKAMNEDMSLVTKTIFKKE